MHAAGPRSIAGGAGIPVVYVGTGERSDALERFHPERIANRILDMGDLATLAERVRDAEIGPAAAPDAEIRAKAAEARALRGGMTLTTFSANSVRCRRSDRSARWSR